MGSLVPESEALEFESAARGESHTWRATREFALLGEILGSFERGTLDLLMIDLPPGKYRYTLKIAGGPVRNDQIEIGAGDTWGVMIAPSGEVLPLQMY